MMSLVSIALPVFGFTTSGQASCNESDPVRGYCLSYADDGHQRTREKALADGWNLVWMTVAGGAVGMVFLWNEFKGKEAIAFSSNPHLSERGQELMQNPEELSQFLATMASAIVSGLNRDSQEFAKDFVDCNRLAKAVLCQAKLIDDNRRRQEIMGCFYQVSEYLHGVKEILPSILISGTVFDGLRAPADFADTVPPQSAPEGSANQYRNLGVGRRESL